jgi:hypothetical protein
VPQGVGADLIATLDGFRARRRRFKPKPERRRRRKAPLRRSIVPVKDFLAAVLDHDKHMRTPRSSLAG